MSKSKGNVIDPLDMVDGISLPELLEKRTGNMMQPQMAGKFASVPKQFPNGIGSARHRRLRFTWRRPASTGRDINWDMKRLEGYRNFCQQAMERQPLCTLMNTEEQDCGFNGGEMTLSLADAGSRRNSARPLKAYREALDKLPLRHRRGHSVRDSGTGFCDWYLELTKPVMTGGSESWYAVPQYAGHRAGRSAALARTDHPVHHETIWQRVKVICGITADTIVTQPFPGEYNAAPGG